jgi:metal-responsive CopG/Arc/MetJ family transcriptional regulator
MEDEVSNKRGRPKATVKSKKRSMTFPGLLYERLERIAARDGRTVSGLIVEAVSKFVREKELGNKQPVQKTA